MGKTEGEGRSAPARLGEDAQLAKGRGEEACTALFVCLSLAVSSEDDGLIKRDVNRNGRSSKGVGLKKSAEKRRAVRILLRRDRARAAFSNEGGEGGTGRGKKVDRPAGA